MFFLVLLWDLSCFLPFFLPPLVSLLCMCFTLAPSRRFWCLSQERTNAPEANVPVIVRDVLRT